MIKKIIKEDKDRCYEFAKQIITGGNQYNRFDKDISTQINRTYIGKLGEYIFLKLLRDEEIPYEEGDILKYLKDRKMSILMISKQKTGKR
tara:strand:+ start:395 stop:664 length:270 start_codon:yes stop_codon:yes gene_type:complete